MSVNGKNEKTAHLVWCAIISLRLARLEGRFSRDGATQLSGHFYFPVSLLRYENGTFQTGPQT